MTRSSSARSWAIRGFPPLLMVLGGAMVIESILSGSSRFDLFLIIPVVSGSAPILLLGVVLLLLGFFLLPVALSAGLEYAGPSGQTSEVARPSPGQGPMVTETAPKTGGFVLIGPVPILFGSFRGLRRRYVLLLSAVGAILLLVLVLLATLG